MNISNVMALTEQYQDLSADRIALSHSIGTDSEERRAVALQVALRSQIARKLPSWSKAQVYIPSHVNLEQSSSEITALLKQRFVRSNDILIDLTGGMGVDFWAMGSIAQESIYTEIDQQLFEATSYNLRKLIPSERLTLLNLDSTKHLEELVHRYNPTLLYIDPARREDLKSEKRVYALEDCRPSLTEVVSRLQQIGAKLRIVAKISPMLDVTHTLRSIPEITALHCISLRNEVKEILLEIDPTREPTLSEEERLLSTPLHSINVNTQGVVVSFSGCFREERETPHHEATSLGEYLYEPFGSLLKLGLYYLIAEKTNTLKLHPHTHLYTSDLLIANFPGRRLRIIEQIPYESKHIKRLYQRLPKAQITCRNFPISVDSLRKKLKITDSDEATIVATTLYDGSHILLLCETT